MKKTQRSEHADKSKNTHPPVSAGLDYVDTDNVHPAEHDRRLSLGHKVSTTREMQYPDPRNKPSRAEHVGPVFNPSSDIDKGG
jgi:hypothetical protein